MSEAEVPVVFIGYPDDFFCYEKFERKVSRILSRMKTYRIACSSDRNGFIERMQNELLSSGGLDVEEFNLLASRLTHAIVFNAHGELDGVVEALEGSAVKTRVVPLSLIKVVNVDKDQQHDVYIGRGSTWGNPYAIGFDGDREEVIRKFAYDFDRGFLQFTKDDVLTLRGKRLGCHCKPSACHGDVLAEYVNSIDDGA